MKNTGDTPSATPFTDGTYVQPVAAYISQGYPPTAFGEEIDRLFTFPIPEPFRDDSGRLVGHIIHIDRYGNLITNLRSRDLPPSGAAVEIRNQRIDNTSPYYAQGSDLIAVVGGNDYLELSVRDGSAAEALGASVGDTVTILDNLLL
jgi:S-adenosylmethionine hydrolase